MDMRTFNESLFFSMIRRYLLSIISKSDWTLNFTHKVYLKCRPEAKSLSCAQEEVDHFNDGYMDMDMDMNV